MMAITRYVHTQIFCHSSCPLLSPPLCHDPMTSQSALSNIIYHAFTFQAVFDLLYLYNFLPGPDVGGLSHFLPNNELCKLRPNYGLPPALKSSQIGPTIINI